MWPRRVSDPPDYPASLLDPRTCVREFLDQIYRLLSVRPYVRKKVRDAQIAESYAHGVSIPALARAYGLSESRIRWIVQHRTRKVD